MNPDLPTAASPGATADLTPRRAETLLKEFAQLGQALSAACTAREASQTIAEIAHRLFAWQGCAIDVYLAEQQQVRPILTMDLVDGRIVDVPPAATNGHLTAWARKAIQKGPHLILRKPSDFSRKGLVPFGDTSKLSASIMVAPIRHGTRVTGVISLHSYMFNAYAKADLESLQALADHCGGALERIWAQEALRESETQLRALAARMQSAREQESLRIAREIHDELGQAMTGLKMILCWMQKKIQAGGPLSLIAEKTDSMMTMVDQTLRSVRRISTELRPRVLDDLGLAAALEWQTQEFQARTGIRCRLAVDETSLQLVKEHATAIFRIYQEILTNVARHSQAFRVSLTVKKSGDHVVLQVRDNGRGITKKEIAGSTSLGLLGMRERALLFGGEVCIHGENGKGTTVTVRIPVVAPPDPKQK